MVEEVVIFVWKQGLLVVVSGESVLFQLFLVSKGGYLVRDEETGDV